jgi:hypothetical protein
VGMVAASNHELCHYADDVTQRYVGSLKVAEWSVAEVVRWFEDEGTVLVSPLHHGFLHQPP